MSIAMFRALGAFALSGLAGCAGSAPPPTVVPDRALGNETPQGQMVSDTDVRPPRAGDLERYLEFLPGEGDLIASLDTSMGLIECFLGEDDTPLTVANFVGLATGQKAWIDPRTDEKRVGVPFYDGLTFHRVIPDFMIQGGDPTGTGVGGPGYRFPDELASSLGHVMPGILSMANSGADTNGSQFFILDGPATHLDGKHTVFGRCDNVDVVAAIARAPAGRNDDPDPEVVIRKVSFRRAAAAP